MNLIEQSKHLQAEAVALRRKLHQYPEWSFGEFRTATLIVQRLRELGYTVLTGRAVCDPAAIPCLPSEEQTEQWASRAIEEGADPALVAQMKGGLTGVVGIMKGEQPGKTVAFRFDIDCNAIDESTDPAHRPAAEGFASRHVRSMHACGHDGHTAIGLTLAKLLADRRDTLCGTVKLIFQPAEEGVRGAKAMVAAGVADDVDYFFSGHIGINQTESHTLAASVGEFLAVRKYEAIFTGKSSHAGLAPQEGRNALLAAAHATLALHSIPRHADGKSRINVGIFNSGGSINAVPDRARIAFETRGETSEINDFLSAEAERIIRASADLQGVDVTLCIMGEADSFDPDPALAEEVAMLAESLGIYTAVDRYRPMIASEDCTAFLRRVTERGGKAAYLMFGAKLAAIHHNPQFDFDESVLWETVALLAALTEKYTKL